MRWSRLAAAVICLGLTLSGASRAGDRLWFGGGVGVSSGDVDYVEVAPMVGFSATEKVSFGGGVTYRYRKDDRFTESLSTSDYGANVFVRYRFFPTLFAHAEYEHLSYEFARTALFNDRDTFNSVLAGPGYIQPMGGRASFFALALYNFSYDENDLYSPYDDEWVYRAGITIGF